MKDKSSMAIIGGGGSALNHRLLAAIHADEVIRMSVHAQTPSVVTVNPFEPPPILYVAAPRLEPIKYALPHIKKPKPNAGLQIGSYKSKKKKK